MATPAPFPASAPAAPVPPPNPEVEAAAQPAPATPSGPAAASDEEVKERVPFIDIILEDGEKHLDLVEGGPRVSGQFEAGDYVMGKFRNDQWYSGTIGAINEDGTFRMNYDDGDVENLTIDRLRTMEEFTAQGLTAATSNRQPKVETVSNFVGKDGTKIECTDGAARANSLTKLFDGRHGRPDTDSSEWRVRMIKGRNVRITITFADPYFITRTRLFPASFNTKKASSNYSLTAIPFVPRFMASVPKPLNVTQGVVGCEHIRIGEWHEYRIDQPLSALVIEFPPHADPNRQHISFGGIDIYHSPAKLASHSIESQSTFRTDFAYLLNNEKFSDCVIKCDGENVYAHKNILAARSEYFRHMFDGPYRESDSSTQEVEMKDVNGRVFLLMMRYLYTDSLAVQSLDDAVELWCVADRLQLTYLKVLVEQFIDGDLSTEKAIGACRLPSIDLYDGLKFRLVSYLADHFEDVMDSEEFVRIPAPILHQVLCQVKAKKAIDLLLKKDKSPGGSNGK